MVEASVDIWSCMLAVATMLWLSAKWTSILGVNSKLCMMALEWQTPKDEFQHWNSKRTLCCPARAWCWNTLYMYECPTDVRGPGSHADFKDKKSGIELYLFEEKRHINKFAKNPLRAKPNWKALGTVKAVLESILQLQWNLSKMDTCGTEPCVQYMKSVLYSQVFVLSADVFC